jgi:hypothetical protein
MPEFRRHHFLRNMQKHRITKVALGIWTLLCGLSVLPILLPPDKAKSFSLYPLFSGWDWYVWLMGFLAIFLVMTVESYFDFYKRKNKEISKLENDLHEQTQIARKADAGYLYRSTEITTLQQDAIRRNTEIEELKKSLSEYSALYGDSESLAHRVSVLSRDILIYLTEKGPQPTLPPLSEGQHKRVHFYFDSIWPFQLQVFNGYRLRFNHRVIKMRDELAENGYIDQELNKAIDSEHSDSSKIAAIADDLLALAEKIRMAKRTVEPIPVTDRDPKIVPECHWADVKYDEQIFQERPITLVNRGGSDAKDIGVSKITRPNGEAEFDVVGFIAKDKAANVLPRIFGPDRTETPFGVSDLLHLMDSEWDFITGEPIISVDFVVHYRDSAENHFVTTAKLERNPLRGTIKFREYKFMRTVEEL